MKPDFEKLRSAVEDELVAADGEQAAEIAAGKPWRKGGLVSKQGEFEGQLKRTIDVYTGPEGKGYVVRFIYESNGEVWSRCVARGPQTFRTRDWIKHPKLNHGSRAR